MLYDKYSLYVYLCSKISTLHVNDESVLKLRTEWKYKIDFEMQTSNYGIRKWWLSCIKINACVIAALIPCQV